MPETAVTDLSKVNTTVLGAQFAPAITVLSGGGYIIVWQDSSAGAIYAQRYSAAGQKVGAELHLDSTQGGSALWVSVAATANDGFVIAFQAGGFSQAEIFGRRYDGADNPVGGLFAVNSTSPNEQFNPHVTTLSNGNLLFTWDTRVTLGNDDVYQEVRGRIFLPDGQALGPDFVVAPVSASVENGISAITPLAGGAFVVTWQQGVTGSDNFEIVGQRFTSGGVAIGSQFQANTQAANSQYGNDVATLSDGSFVVTWVDPGAGGVGGRIVARHYDASGAAIGGEILIDSKASGAYGRTVVTPLAGGAYVVAWTEGDPANNNVLARHIGSNDVPVSPAFEMAFDSPFSGNFFSDGVITLPNGDVVFAWDGPSITPPGGPGTGQDIYTRQYRFTAGSVPTTGDDTLNGTSGDDVIDGLAGNDTIYGLAGNDTLYGRDGADFLFGSDGNDRLEGGDGNDWLAAGTGVDILIGGAGDDLYSVDDIRSQVIEDANGGTDTVATTLNYTLPTNVEIVRLFGNASTAVDAYGNAGDNGLMGSAGNNYLSGGDGHDWLDGQGGDDFLVGGVGNDYLRGGDGRDRLQGGVGNDIYLVEDTTDTIEENAGEGTDLVYSTVNITLSANIEQLRLLGSGLVDGYGNTGDNIIIGAAGNNYLNGGGGVDWLSGEGGNDYIEGGDGNDGITGGLGADRLFGNAGADTFYWYNPAESTAASMDTVGDFQTGVDRIYLASIRTGASDAFTLTASGGNTIISVDLGGNGSEDMRITVTGTVAVSDVIWGSAPASASPLSAPDAAKDGPQILPGLDALTKDDALVLPGADASAKDADPLVLPQEFTAKPDAPQVLPGEDIASPNDIFWGMDGLLHIGDVGGRGGWLH